MKHFQSTAYKWQIQESFWNTKQDGLDCLERNGKLLWTSLHHEQSEPTTSCIDNETNRAWFIRKKNNNNNNSRQLDNNNLQKKHDSFGQHNNKNCHEERESGDKRGTGA